MLLAITLYCIAHYTTTFYTKEFLNNLFNLN